MLPRRRAAYAADMVKVTDRLNALLATTTFEHNRDAPYGRRSHTVVRRLRPGTPQASMRQLTATDAAFLNVEQPRTPMHLTSLLIFDPTSRPARHVRAHPPNGRAAGAHVPSYDSAFSTFRSLDYPWWYDDGVFDSEYHVRHETLPEPRRLATVARAGATVAQPARRPGPTIVGADGGRRPRSCPRCSARIVRDGPEDPPRGHRRHLGDATPGGHCSPTNPNRPEPPEPPEPEPPEPA